MACGWSDGVRVVCGCRRGPCAGAGEGRVRVQARVECVPGGWSEGVEEVCEGDGVGVIGVKGREDELEGVE